MKTPAIGIVSAAILILVTAVGFGIAQGGGNYTYDPMLSIGDQDVNPLPGEDMYRGWGFNDWGNPYLLEGAVETGSLPADSNEEDMYRGWGINEWGNNE
jgi:hypothetical protein